MSPPRKRRAVVHLVKAKSCSVRVGCRAAGLGKSSYYYRRKDDGFQRRLVERLHELSGRHPRYGYRRMSSILRREGWCVNKKRIQRLMRIEGLKVLQRGKRRRRLGLSTAQRRKATHRNHVWSWDIVHDRSEEGRQLKFLGVVDEYTRECLRIGVGRHLRAEDVIGQLMVLMKEHGVPEHIRSDNGPEFTAKALERWLEFNRIGTVYITPGSPWENPYIESFIGKFRDECLNRELFINLLEAQVVVEQWRKDYNEHRPHSSLGYMTPAEFASRCSKSSAAVSSPILSLMTTGAY